MPLFAPLLDELRVTLAKRRQFIDSTLDSTSTLPTFPSPVPAVSYIDRIHHSVYLKQKVLAQIRAFEKKEEDLRASLIAVSADSSPTQERVEPTVPRGWSLWSLLGY